MAQRTHVISLHPHRICSTNSWTDSGHCRHDTRPEKLLALQDVRLKSRCPAARNSQTDGQLGPCHSPIILGALQGLEGD